LSVGPAEHHQETLEHTLQVVQHRNELLRSKAKTSNSLKADIVF